MKLLKILPVLGLLFVGLWLAPEAEAALVKNKDTGYKSTNRAKITDRKVFDQKSFKLGFVANIDIVDADTGGNEADKNTGGTNDVDSGKADADVTTDDYVNYNLATVNQCSTCDDTSQDSAINNNTGAKSTNVAKIERVRRATVHEASIGGVINFSHVTADSGDNSASKNTGGGNTVDSGNATATVNHTSDVNTSIINVTQ